MTARNKQRLRQKMLKHRDHPSSELSDPALEVEYERLRRAFNKALESDHQMKSPRGQVHFNEHVVLIPIVFQVNTIYESCRRNTMLPSSTQEWWGKAVCAALLTLSSEVPWHKPQYRGDMRALHQSKQEPPAMGAAPYVTSQPFARPGGPILSATSYRLRDPQCTAQGLNPGVVSQGAQWR